MRGVPVTTRIRQINQPGDGYLSPKLFNEYMIVPEDSPYAFMYSRESLHGRIVGLAVDYLTRLALGDSAEDAFKIPLMGARIMEQEDRKIKHYNIVSDLINEMKSSGPEQIISNACQIVSYDSVFRAGPQTYEPIEYNIPDPSTTYNILTMVNRMVHFDKTIGPMTDDGFTFEGGYSDIVSKGDGDFLTKDTLWDMKVLRSEITKDHTLQILMYYLMGKKSVHSKFDSIENIGLVNPRLNKYYLLSINEIDKKIINDVKNKVIGY